MWEGMGIMCVELLGKNLNLDCSIITGEGTEEGKTCHIEAESTAPQKIPLNFSNLEFPQRWVLTGRKTWT